MLCSFAKIIRKHRKIRNFYFLDSILKYCVKNSVYIIFWLNFTGCLNKDYSIVSALFWIAKQSKTKFTKNPNSSLVSFYILCRGNSVTSLWLRCTLLENILECALHLCQPCVFLQISQLATINTFKHAKEKISKYTAFNGACIPELQILTDWLG